MIMVRIHRYSSLLRDDYVGGISKINMGILPQLFTHGYMMIGTAAIFVPFSIRATGKSVKILI